MGATPPTIRYARVTATNESGSSTTEIRPISAYQTVSVKYLGKDGAILDTRTGLVPVNIPYTLLLIAINNHQAVYYKVDDGGRQEINLASPPALTITGNTEVAVYCSSTIMTISCPVYGMSTAVCIQHGGAVMAGSYEFENQPDLPVWVSFKGMSVTDDAGLSFVQNAT